jgi:choline kinase
MPNEKINDFIVAMGFNANVIKARVAQYELKVIENIIR